MSYNTLRMGTEPPSSTPLTGAQAIGFLETAQQSYGVGPQKTFPSTPDAQPVMQPQFVVMAQEVVKTQAQMGQLQKDVAELKVGGITGWCPIGQHRPNRDPSKACVPDM